MKHRRPCPDLTNRKDEVMAYIMRKTIVTTGGCWEWQGHRNSVGYGQGCFANRQWIVTRLVQCAVRGAFDRVLDVCHSCDNPACCNPDHLWLGTMKDNIRDARQKGRHFLGARTECPKGHPYAPDNTATHVDIHGHSHRRCLTCERAKGRIWNEQKAERQRQKRLRARLQSAAGGQS